MRVRHARHHVRPHLPEDWLGLVFWGATGFAVVGIVDIVLIIYGVV